MSWLSDTQVATATATDSTPPVVWWIGGIIVAVIFGVMVWRTVKRNRLK